MKKNIILVALLSLTAVSAVSCSGKGKKTTSQTSTSSISSDAPHTHSYSEWETTKKATCEEDGERKRTCSCGKEETDTIPKLGHSIGVTGACENEGCSKTLAQEQEQSTIDGLKQLNLEVYNKKAYFSFTTVCGINFSLIENYNLEAEDSTGENKKIDSIAIYEESDLTKDVSESLNINSLCSINGDSTYSWKFTSSNKMKGSCKYYVVLTIKSDDTSIKVFSSNIFNHVQSDSAGWVDYGDHRVKNGCSYGDHEYDDSEVEYYLTKSDLENIKKIELSPSMTGADLKAALTACSNDKYTISFFKSYYVGENNNYPSIDDSQNLPCNTRIYIRFYIYPKTGYCLNISEQDKYGYSRFTDTQAYQVGFEFNALTTGDHTLEEGSDVCTTCHNSTAKYLSKNENNHITTGETLNANGSTFFQANLSSTDTSNWVTITCGSKEDLQKISAVNVTSSSGTKLNIDSADSPKIDEDIFKYYVQFTHPEELVKLEIVTSGSLSRTVQIFVSNEKK